MLWIDIVFFALIAAYCNLLAYFSKHWHENTRADGQRLEDRMQGGLTVLVAARNEEDHILHCVNALLDQKWSGEIQIIVIDDHSEDNTLGILRDAYGNGFDQVEILSSPTGVWGKKQALAYAMDQVRTEWVLTTDADCIADPGWVDALMQSRGSEAVTGPVLIDEAKSIFDGFQALDLLSLAMVTGGGVNAGMFTLANGGNMGYSTKAYREVGGYLRNSEYASGDDLFLVQNIVAMHGKDALAYCTNVSGATYTKPESSLRAFIRQRKRWASKNSSLPQPEIQRIWAFVWLINFSFLMAILGSFIGLISIPVILTTTFMKFGVEYIVLNRIAQHYELNRLMRFFPISFFMNLVYTTGLVLLPLLGKKYEWKGRTTS